MSTVWPAGIQKSFAFFIFVCGIILPTIVYSATNSITVQWAVNSESDLAGYHVYQGTDSGSYGPPIDVGNTTTYTAGNLQSGLTYYYAVTAYDTAGNESPPSTEVSKFFEGSDSVDTIPPSVSVTSPIQDATLSGSVTVSASATDNIGVVGVQIQVNGTDLGVEDATTPFSISWDTAGETPGQYSLTAIARDAAGNTTSSVPVLVTISEVAKADFTSDLTSGNAPLTVTFTDLSSGTPTSWSWDFGDGSSSTAQHPSHTYTDPGTYTVTLTASNAEVSNVKTKVDHITVTEPTLNVIGISPNSIASRSKKVPVTIFGNGFVSGATVVFSDGDGPTPTITNVTVVDPQNITASLTTKSGGPPRDRYWTIKVINPDGGSAIFSDGLLVTPYR